MFLFFGPEAPGILAPQRRMEPAPPGLEGKALATGPPGKFPSSAFRCTTGPPQIWRSSFIEKGKWDNWEAQLVSYFAIFSFNVIAQEQAIVCSWAGKQ